MNMLPAAVVYGRFSKAALSARGTSLQARMEGELSDGF
jgi:hypothetical protein